MSNSANHHKISYIEFASTDIEQTKKFYYDGLRMELCGLWTGLCQL